MNQGHILEHIYGAYVFVQCEKFTVCAKIIHLHVREKRMVHLFNINKSGKSNECA